MPVSAGGVLLDQQGDLVGLWISFAYEGSDGNLEQGSWGLPAWILAETLAAYQADTQSTHLGWHPRYISLAAAARSGLDAEWVDRLIAVSGAKRRVIEVEAVLNGSEAAEVLQPGDLVLAIGDTPVTQLYQLDEMLQETELQMTIFRNGSILTVSYQPPTSLRLGAERVLYWAGAYIQQAPIQVGYKSEKLTQGVYISQVDSGSPAARDSLYGNRFIIEVEGIPVKTLDEFQAQVAKVPTGENVRLLTQFTAGHKVLLAVRPDYQFWPTQRFSHDGQSWQRQVLRRD